MPSLIHTLSLQWDLWSGPYRAFFPTGKGDLKACRALTQKPERDEYRAAGSPKIKHQLAACHDSRSGEIIACLKLADALLLKAFSEKAAQYQLDLFTDSQLSKIAVFTDLVIQPAQEKTPILTVLISHCFIEVLKAGGLAMLLSGDPELFSVYKRLGIRPVGPLQKSAAGTPYIPMILLPDQDYLSLINSPLLPLLRGIDFAPYQPICQWYYHLVRENSELQIGAAFYPKEEESFEGHDAITDGLSADGKDAFLKNALVINCREGEILISEEDGGKAFGFVRQGIVKVVIGGKTVVLLGKGDIFGEIAFILSSKRTAQVVAASPETEVVLFSESAINHLERESDQTTIWRNLARVLAQRVVLTNKLLD
jgi:hypothetical protein